MIATRFIQRAAMTAAQKTGATLATRVATSIASTFTGYIIQSNIIKAKGAKLNKRIQDGEEISEKEIKTAQTEAFASAAVVSGVCSGVGLITNNAIANIIKGL